MISNAMHKHVKWRTESGITNSHNSLAALPAQVRPRVNCIVIIGYGYSLYSYSTEAIQELYIAGQSDPRSYITFDSIDNQD